MPTYFRDRIHSSLSPAEAKRVVSELCEFLEAQLPNEADERAAVGDEPPEALEGLSVTTAFHLRQNEDDDVIDVYEGLEIDVDPDGPPSEADAKERAKATGYVAHSFVFERAAMKLLPECRSTIALRYPARLEHNRSFLVVLQRLFARAGSVVVESGDGTRYQTAETIAEIYGEAWKKAARPKNERRPERRKREAKPGEVESVAIREALSEVVEGDDPFVKKALRSALEGTTDAVRAYAAAVLEEGAKSDATLAKAMGWKAKDVAEARTALAALIDGLARD